MSFKCTFQLCFFLLFTISVNLFASDVLFLRDNLKSAQKGDYIVISCNKTDTLLHINDKKDSMLTIEEVTVPEARLSSKNLNWKEWMSRQAPGSTSWIMYEIDLATGKMVRYYSFTKRDWFELNDPDNFLHKLLNLKLVKTPDQFRKRIGSKPVSGPDWRPLWQPRMVVEGKEMADVQFDAWRTKWPKDGTELSERTIEIYLPKDNQKYPAYFPYWLQISGTVGKAKIRIINSGRQLQSPKPSLDELARSYQQSANQASKF